jgi:hypothetical protein
MATFRGPHRPVGITFAHKLKLVSVGFADGLDVVAVIPDGLKVKPFSAEKTFA